MKNKFSIIISLLFFISLASCHQFVDSEFGAFDIQDNRNNDGGEVDNPDQDTFIEVFLLGSKMVFVGDEALINVTLPSGTDVSNLAPDIVVPEGSTVTPASGEPQDFTNPVIYTVTLSNGASKSYTVRINVAKATTNELLSFAVGEHQGVFEDNDIYLVLPYGSSLLQLEPVFSHNGASVFPELGTKLDFTEPVEYTVTAENGSTRVYAVFMSVALSDEKDILSFSILDTEAEIAGENLLLTVPYGTSLVGLSPTIVINGEQVSPASGIVQDFTDSDILPIVYTVRAADGSTREYFVTVTVIEGFFMGDQEAFTLSGVDFNMVYVEGGIPFPTGTNDAGSNIVNDDYFIGETHVTCGLVDAVKDEISNQSLPYVFTDTYRCGSHVGGSVNQPVTMMNFYDAIVFTNALSAILDLEPVYRVGGSGAIITNSNQTDAIDALTDSSIHQDYNGFRLPTRWEHEFAARYRGDDPTNTVSGYTSPYFTKGNSASGATDAYTNALATQEVAWYDVNSDGASKEVKQKPPNTLGLYDMSGNAWQWQFDLGGSGRVIRGGRWVNRAYYMQIGGVSDRDGYSPGLASVSFGFRLARTAL
jgi:hypothetical protein